MATFDFDEPSENLQEADQGAYVPPAADFLGDDFVGGGENAPAPLLDDEFVNGDSKLPPLYQTEPEESLLLKQWRKKRAEELEQKARISREKHEKLVEEARTVQEEFYKKRENKIAQAKEANREKEKSFLSSLTNLNAKAGGNTWESVTAFISFDLKKEGKKVGKRSNEPQRVSTLLNDTKPGKHTDKARMRQILLKLKHNPPVHAAVVTA